ncbi:hypothetical protein [Rhizobium sp. 2MFCol3.1]|uniref:hypothetical protein n=1 Tax=Rhizobium sp. 2MFCol3.1 TaxID=1246459 RepID=UPI00036F8E39|nr:hypothetical protein [Rhizobium sp. 2MFCol3.1]
MSFTKKGKSFPYAARGKRGLIDELKFATVISLALERAVEDTQLNVKTVVGWTGANDRTVKNWFSGRYAPLGHHLMLLATHCDDVMEAIIMMAGRDSLLVAVSLDDVERRLTAALALVRSVQATGLGADTVP